ncbi:MAG TPA: ROK family protein [Cyclobacteriaceae bacterium]|jgi:glucokinase|nr:ROK family protein [Cyclobacteriaceae bacterium]
MMTIGVDLGGTNIRAGISKDGLITHRLHSTLREKESLSNTLGQVIDIIKPLIEPAVEGIGIAVPSVVDTDKGIVYNVVNIPSWERVELKDILQNTFKVPVQVDNDANCFVLGEQLFGAEKDAKSIVGIVLGTGIGSGIIINGKLYTGSNSGAGEIGYLPYLDKNIEYYCSSTFFSGIKNTTAFEAHRQAMNGDLQAISLWHEFGIHLGNAVKAVLYAYDPEVIVFGGSITKAYPFFYESMRNSLSDFIYPQTIKKLKIIQSKDDNITLLGAGSLLRKEGNIH